MVSQALIKTKIAHIYKNIDKLSRKKNISLKGFKSDTDIQDIVIHNLQLAIQGTIDIASHIISDKEWGISTTLAGLYDILLEHKVINKKTADIMKKMVGFRNIIIHEYEEIDIDKVYQILTSRLGDFGDFLKQVAGFVKL